MGGTGEAADGVLRTRWEDVDALARAPDVPARHAAWARLAERYRPALLLRMRQVIARRAAGRMSPDEAEDVLQGFLAEGYEKRWFERADPRRGRLRDFLRVLATRYARDAVRGRRAACRSPAGARLLSLDEEGVPPPSGPTPRMGATFDEAWVRCLVEQAMPRVEARSAPAAAILRALLREGESPSAAPPPLTNREKVARHRARVMLAEELWEEVRRTVRHPEELAQERAALAPFLARYLGPDEAASSPDAPRAP